MTGPKKKTRGTKFRTVLLFVQHCCSPAIQLLQAPAVSSSPPFGNGDTRYYHGNSSLLVVAPELLRGEVLPRLPCYPAHTAPFVSQCFESGGCSASLYTESITSPVSQTWSVAFLGIPNAPLPALQAWWRGWGGARVQALRGTGGSFFSR